MKSEVYLTRKDLIEAKKHSPIEEIGLYDFKVSLPVITEASLVVFDEDTTDDPPGLFRTVKKVLKDRDGNYLNGLRAKYNG